MQPRPLDHLVLPTRDLAVARERLSALGFTVAPEGVHPFGTKNCCVYFADGTFLEPLAIADENAVRRASRSANVFVSRDAIYRYRLGEEGFSALVFATQDALGDHKFFLEEECSAGPMLEFDRPFVDGEGRRDIASFRLAFAADARAPDIFLFTCQRVRVPKVDRSALEEHANSVLGITEVVLSAPKAADFTSLLLAAVGQEFPDFQRHASVAQAGGSLIVLMDDTEFRSRFGATSSGDRGLRARAVVFRVSDLEIVASHLGRNGISFSRRDGRLLVYPAPGQGAIFAFEAL